LSIDAFKNKTARVGVIGLGYVGLPLAVEFAHAGYHVVGFDVVEEKVQGIRAGKSHIRDVPSDVLAPVVRSGKLEVTTDFSRLAELDSANICVPTPLRKTRDPDVSYIVSAVEEIAKYLHPGMLVLLESTTYPGTTEELILPRLEETGLKVGVDFFLAFSPERVDPGNPKYTTRNIPKVVGGITPACTEHASALYGAALDNVVPVSSTRVAEMVKLLENTFRSVNIGLVNELALMCDSMGIGVWEVIDAAATKPFGFMPFYPGPGLGGHCIPIDPFYLSWKARQVGFEARFIELAGQVNSFMPRHVVAKAGEALNDHGKSVRGSKILVLGVAYKNDIEDVRESPALDIINELRRLGADVAYSDPYVHALEEEGIDLKSVTLTDDVIGGADLVVITTGHRTVDYPNVVRHAAAVLDTRNVLKGHDSPNIRRL
jgi:UDP-N-acetyl-D-glucosamine dehydrogenase